MVKFSDEVGIQNRAKEHHRVRIKANRKRSITGRQGGLFYCPNIIHEGDFMLKIGETFLISTDNWFVAPNGRQYKAVFGTVREVADAESTIGIKTNRNSTNWYVVIGNMLVAGCQIHYAIKTKKANFGAVSDFDASGPAVVEQQLPFSRIYNADADAI